MVTQLDEGMTLSEYLALNANQPLSYTAMRSIIGEVIESLHALQKDVQPLGTVDADSTGNNGEDHTEGARVNNVIGTYMPIGRSDSF